MVKKRAKGNMGQESLDTEPVCKHIRKGLEEGNVKKALLNVEGIGCQDCQADNKGKDTSEEEMAEDISIWLCLKCGHRGCGRNSEQQHALKHYNTPRSEPHCMVLNFDMWSVWCYLCDNEVPYINSSRLGQLVEYIQKKAKANVQTPPSSVSMEQEVSNHENKVEKDMKALPKEEDTNSLAKEDIGTPTRSSSKEATVKGLSNLGNTCFFNAVMQNLSQTPTLRELLNEVRMAGQTLTIKLPDSSLSTHLEVSLEQQPGPLTLAMCQFLTEVQGAKRGVVTPKELFSQVCKKAIRFKGYQQQDSQELLRYLLDGMRGEEIQRIIVAMSKALHDTSEKIDEEEIKKKVKECEKRRAVPNFVDRLFGGELTSTIMCDECQTVSLVHEPFLDLSLPVLDDLLLKKNIPKASKIVHEKNDEEENDDSYIKERNEVSPGPSKHLQKKAKKQAKKQAKNQRRQQKVQDTAIQFSDLNTMQDNQNGNEETVLHNDSELETNLKQEDEIGTRLEELGGSENDAESQENNTEKGAANQENNTEKDAANQENNTEKDAANQENNTEKDAANQENNTEKDAANQENNTGKNAANQNDNTGKDAENLKDNTEISAILENGVSDQFNIEDIDLQDETLEDLTASTMVTDPCTENYIKEDELTNSLNRLNLCPDLDPSEIDIEIIDGRELSTQCYEVVNEDPEVAFCTLADRKELPSDECSVQSCLYQFTRKENLTGNNQLLCNVCTRKEPNGPKKNVKGEKKHVYTNAKKQMLVSLPPPILTLHLKRFQQAGFNLRKINRHIKFPEVIDLAPFCNVKCKNIPEGDSTLLYSLYGVIEHSGTMRSGHYTAYVKLRNPCPRLCEMVLGGVIPEVSNGEPAKGHWYHISDTHVQAVPVTKVLSSQAYLLFYERTL
ncbi:ubiquitin carboxyl-terminal hydrolase 16 isoform X2 [Ascaphus truei]|uniref:ubiquitin carboxyl-terminal hydrolase 16 isoform X2 n=1 Tax=Ascaphus truei TaxID=8439 RepID=UPI003F59A0C6